ncbi:H-type lectin domain-containing protein [Falsirhodobacter sp. 20TX0035]|uniref:H-type lectin domain-containing protein n=1 Tax=Falsirhodobacter sp. 20TX0035 TaxID=3022019 RepID=UPI00232F3C14|nr:H-type lectin domain-containing protein [Falsirhodobacter sp. 20TX0035]MDB6453807.1 H-type lectin domain-containing protein [Falsirhodobacter sp. 20TX0035]
MKQIISTASLGILRGSQMMFTDFADGGEMWTSTGPRERRRPILFSDRFTNLPVVTVTVSMWDMAQETAFRADLSAENVRVDGFDLVFRTWSDTRIARIRADWVALGPMRDDDQWDVE